MTGWSKTASVVSGVADMLPFVLAKEESLCSDRAELNPLELEGRLERVAVEIQFYQINVNEH